MKDDKIINIAEYLSCHEASPVDEIVTREAVSRLNEIFNKADPPIPGCFNGFAWQAIFECEAVPAAKRLGINEWDALAVIINYLYENGDFGR